MKVRKSVAFFATLIAGLIVLAGCAGMEPAYSTELQFVTHQTAGMVEQDVFVTHEDLPGDQVMRATLEDLEDPAILDQMVLKSGAPTEHDPFAMGEAPLGPFSRGDELGVTMAEWLAASGTGRYSTQGDDATIEASFENLIPGGTYTIWCTRIKTPPAPVIFDIACGQWDGADNTMIAADDGTASFSIAMQPMMDTADDHISMVAIAYHSDGKTWGPLPGEFGTLSHVQAFAILPPPGAETWSTTVEPVASAK